jgi:hypothetical protein
MLFTIDDEEIKGEKYDKYAKVDPTFNHLLKHSK